MLSTADLERPSSYQKEVVIDRSSHQNYMRPQQSSIKFNDQAKELSVRGSYQNAPITTKTYGETPRPSSAFKSNNNDYLDAKTAQFSAENLRKRDLISKSRALRVEASSTTLEKNRISLTPQEIKRESYAPRKYESQTFEPGFLTSQLDQRATRNAELPSKPSGYKLNLEYASPIHQEPLSVRNSSLAQKYGDSPFKFYSPKYSSQTNNLVSQSLSNFNPQLSSTRFYDYNSSRTSRPTTEKPNLESKRFYEPLKVENNYYSYQNGELTPSNKQFYKEIHSKQF